MTPARASIPLLILAASLSATPSRSDGLIATHRIPATMAMEAVTAAVTTCTGHGYHVTAVVTDADGLRQAELRGDGAGPHTQDGAWRKAYTAVTVSPIRGGDSTAQLAARVGTDQTFQALEFLPGILFVAGGLTIRSGDEVIGAIGVAGGPGGDTDEACARAGLDRIRDRLK